MCVGVALGLSAARAMVARVLDISEPTKIDSKGDINQIIDGGNKRSHFMSSISLWSRDDFSGASIFYWSQRRGGEWRGSVCKLLIAMMY